MKIIEMNILGDITYLESDYGDKEPVAKVELTIKKLFGTTKIIVITDGSVWKHYHTNKITKVQYVNEKNGKEMSEDICRQITQFIRSKAIYE